MTDSQNHTRTTSIRLSDEGYRFLKEQDNASALIRDLLTNYRLTGDRGTAGLELQLKHAKEKKDERERRLEREIEMYERQIEEYEALIQRRNKKEDTELQEARDALEKTPRDTENPAIVRWSKQLGMTPDELIEELDDE